MDQVSDPYAKLPRVIGHIDHLGEVMQNELLKDSERVLINAGSTNGITVGQRVVVFGVGPEIVDPVTQESLGRFEVVRGIGKIASVMDRMAVVECTDIQQDRKVVKGSSLLSPRSMFSEPDVETITIRLPFQSVALGDLIRKV
ncbi:MULTISPECIES: hypothetical protein [Novosphingobium]|uniref:Uncharacterized protein n=1 Tax=Novosphingobium sediminicola TaxID=563162 RepID=A0A7W6G6Z4_9SPHN|nr:MULTISPECIES: hypothetical protein [Novosphingobium]MBB3956289.1 hypothetical protein [Novosphingobium sediminicola]MDR6710363.1 hypothetical protein [Novosphingobium sp. 1748]